jgi:hypothetical protein
VRAQNSRDFCELTTFGELNCEHLFKDLRITRRKPLVLTKSLIVPELCSQGP